MAQKLGLEVVLAAEFRLAGGAGQKFKDEVGLELGCERTSLTTWHVKSPGSVQY